MYGQFSFAWQVDFTLDPVGLELKAMEVKLTEVRVSDGKHDNAVRSTLQKVVLVVY